MVDRNTPRELPSLNPFALPTETALRFNMLILAAVMQALTLGGTLTLWLSDALGWPPIGEIWDLALDVETFDLASSLSVYLDRMRRSLGYMLLPLLVVGAVLVLAWIIYRRHPARIRRRKGLQPVTHRDDPRFVSAVAAMVQAAGLAEAPTIESSKDSKALDGQAFGLRGQYALRLGGRLRLLQRKRPSLFQAIVLHELAHIKNDDIRRTYFAQALWVAAFALTVIVLIFNLGVFAVTTLTELAAVGFGGFDWGRFWGEQVLTLVLMVLQGGATLVVMAALRGSVLRVREIYADWRAALWGASPALAAILRGQSQEEDVSWWQRLLRLHPPPEKRLAALEDPSRLFQLDLEIPLIAGILLAFVISGMFMLLGNWATPLLGTIELGIFGIVSPVFTNPTALGIILSFLVLLIVMPATLVLLLSVFLVPAYLVAATVGAQLQRQSILHALTQQRGCGTYLRLALPAILLAVGLQAGLLIVPLNTLAPLWNDHSWLIVAVMPVWLVSVSVLMWLWLIYARAFGLRMIARCIDRQPPTRSRRLLTLAFSLMLWVLLTPVVVGQLWLSINTLELNSTVMPLSWIAQSAGAALVLYVILFALTWLVVTLRTWLRRKRCPHCQQRVTSGHTAGQPCPHCGRTLGPWLVLDLASREMALRARHMAD